MIFYFCFVCFFHGSEKKVQIVINFGTVMSKAQFSQGVAHMYIIKLNEPKFYVFAADFVWKYKLHLSVLCYHELNLQTQKGGKICRKNIFSIIGELELKLLAVVENYWVIIIHCLWASCKQTYHLYSMQVLSSRLQLYPPNSV